MHWKMWRVGVLVMACGVAACSSSKKDDEDEKALVAKDRPLEQLYDEAWDLHVSRKYRAAADAFEEVERQYPYSDWATRAKVMAAYSDYRAGEYDKALIALENFVKLHPANRSTAYAYYLISLCYYEQISDVGRDQGNTQQALAAMQEVIRKFPDTPYARDAKVKTDLVFDHLAGKEMEIGRYYQKRGEMVAAMNRFTFVVEKYQTTSHVPEALHRLVESYLTLGVEAQAKKYAAVLGYNFPQNEWYKRSYALMTGRGIDLEKEGWFEKVKDVLPFTGDSTK